MAFQRVSSGAHWEERVGYCRALRAGDRIFVSGTAAVDPDGSVHAPGDVYRQTLRCLEIVRDALEGLGASLADVTRTRIFVTDITRWDEVGRAHGALFRAHPPVTSMVEVRALIHPDMLVEVEADAVPATPTRSSPAASS